jgi:hypothetical protein
MLVGVSWTASVTAWARTALAAHRSTASRDAWASGGAPPALPPGDCAVAIRAELTRRAGGGRGTVSFDEALAVICGATGWPVGHVWVHGPTGWRSSGAWHSDGAAGTGAPGTGTPGTGNPGTGTPGTGSPGTGTATDRYAGLREATAITDLGSGRGIVAAVLHLESCRFLPGLEGLGSPLRQAHAAALGLRGVIGVPVRASVDGDHKVAAILEFVTPTEVEPDGALAEALLEVAARSRRRVVRRTASPVRSPSKSLDVEVPNHLAG